MPTPDPPIARNPIPQGTPCALVYGGSFDPPHNAHLTLPPLVRDAIGADHDHLLAQPIGPHRRQFRPDQKAR